MIAAFFTVQKEALEEVEEAQVLLKPTFERCQRALLNAHVKAVYLSKFMRFFN